MYNQAEVERQDSGLRRESEPGLDGGPELDDEHGLESEPGWKGKPGLGNVPESGTELGSDRVCVFV